MSSNALIEVEIPDFDGVCFLIGHPTGVSYPQQCGGLACDQRRLKGFLVPCPDSIGMAELLPKHFHLGPKYGGHCCDGIDEEDAALIDRLAAPLYCGALSVDRDRLGESVEAWVRLKVAPGEPCFPYCFNSNPAAPVVMIWNNSD